MARICVEWEGRRKLFSFVSIPDISHLKEQVCDRFALDSSCEILITTTTTTNNSIKCDDLNFREYYNNGAHFNITVSHPTEYENQVSKRRDVNELNSLPLSNTEDDLSKYMIPQDIIKKFWGEHTTHVPSVSIAHLQELLSSTKDARKVGECDVVERWKTRGFIVVELPGDVVKLHATLLEDFQNFLALPLDQKKECVSPLQHYLGYQHRPHYNKELFQVRKSAIDVYKGEEATRFRESADKYFSEMLNICKLFVKLACAAVGMTEESKVDRLAEDPHMKVEMMGCEPSFVSQSNCSVFHYNLDQRPLQEFVHCPYHTDVGLVTIIPRCKGVHGLHVFDHSDSIWLDFERDAPDNCAVVFGGESLARLSNNFIPPCYHEVSHMAGERFSAPVQCLANRNAVLDYNDLDPSIVGPCYSGYEVPIPASIFVNNVSASRISSNFSRMV